ncbi:S41 family peptidase [Pedobacter sp. SD-b]|uniref:S41 family peptidase n=1 Tax=Pedobacter segetis TaxID=2793069 RepID=A0ABS1BJS2_9SPHI|nr:S41 family peptidase [Pedobacter segetis]MBK0383052.1 S41 family peptidase [Pedobacter segetis]
MFGFPKNTLRNTLIIVITVLIGMILGATYQQKKNDGELKIFPSISLQPKEKLDRILKVIKNNYVDSVNTDSLQELAINDILNSLDPHTVYLPPVQAKNQNESLEGNFDGIGIEYYILNDTLFVTHVRENGPSFKAGLLKGDKITAVNDKNLADKKLLSENIVNSLRGKSGSNVKVTVKRKGSPKPLFFDITRDKIVVSSIDVAFLIDKETGFIKISRFGANTEEDFSDALDRLMKNGMKSLILDLRGNGGGYLNAATALADQFLPDGKLIVYTKGLHEPRTDYTSTKDGLFEKGNLAVLIDEGTASASEILTGALQDLDRATIIGRRSFGKGLVQEQFGFDDGSAMNLTIARYYTTSGRSIQKSYTKGKDVYKDEINKRFEHGDYTSLDSALTDSTFLPKQKFKTAKGRVVYGGGGIMPDIFIPLDTSKYSTFYQKINEKGLITKYVYDVLINHINPKQFVNAADFTIKYKISDKEYQGFLNFCTFNKVDYKLNETQLSKPLIDSQMKALLARYYFDEEGFYRVLNKDDDFVEKALVELRK